MDYLKMVDLPLKSLENITTTFPQHPYSLIGLDVLSEAIRAFQSLCEEAGYPLRGSLESNRLLPTAIGTLRPTCLAPETMISGDFHRRSPMLIVGFNQYLDFYPSLIADNLNAQHLYASDIMLDLPCLRDRRFVSSMTLARLFDTPEFRQEVVKF